MSEEGKTLEQLSAEFELDVRQIPVGDIEPNDANPNEMDEADYQALVLDVREHGFTQPVLVRPMGETRDGDEHPEDGYKLIDGEHRWRAVCEVGVQKIPAIVLNVDSDDEALVRLLTMNKFKGKLIPIKTAQVIADLAKRIPHDELSRRLGFSAGQLENQLRLANFKSGLGERIKAKGARPATPTRKVLRFSVGREDAEIIERVIDTLTDGRMERGEALALVCRDFERANRVEGSSPRAKSRE